MNAGGKAGSRRLGTLPPSGMEQGGIDPEKAPETFAQVLEYAEKLTKKDGDKVTQYGFSMAIYGWFFEQLIDPHR